MQIDKDGQAVFLGPVEGLVEFVDAADERRAVAEDEVRHGDAHGVQSPRFDGGEVALVDVFGAVGPDAGLVDGRIKLRRQIVFVIGSVPSNNAGFIHFSRTSQLPRFTPLM